MAKLLIEVTPEKLAELLRDLPPDQARPLCRRPPSPVMWSSDDLTILGIFSGPPQPSQPTWIVLSSRDRNFPETGLKTTSLIKAERIAVIEKSVIVRKLGSLSSSQMEKVKTAVKLALNLD